MQATIPVALNTILPKGWSTIIAPGVALPGRVSWAPTDTWLDTLSRIANRTDAGFLVDWSERKLIVHSVSETMQLVAQIEQIRQQATVPLPAFTQQHSAVATAVPVSPPPSSTSQSNVPVTPATAAVPSVQSVSQVASPPAHQETPSVSNVRHQAAAPVDPARSFTSQSIREVLTVLAEHYHLRLEWQGPDYPLPGPVTLRLRGDLEEDVALLQRALGPVAPLAVIYYLNSQELVVQRAEQSTYTVFESRPTPPVARPSLWARLVGKLHGDASEHGLHTDNAPAQAASGSSPSSSPSSAALAPAPASAPAPVTPQKASSPTVVLNIATGDKLSATLERFLRAQGWQLSWQVPNDLQAEDAARLTGESVRGVLGKLLPSLGLTDNLDEANHAVVITPAPSSAAAASPP